ncbi:MAG TPA: hypothetical protein VNN55_09015 [bacterium]|nr:hypothetical protein [bacterium]
MCYRAKMLGVILLLIAYFLSALVILSTGGGPSAALLGGLLFLPVTGPIVVAIVAPFIAFLSPD